MLRMFCSAPLRDVCLFTIHSFHITRIDHHHARFSYASYLPEPALVTVSDSLSGIGLQTLMGVICLIKTLLRLGLERASKFC